jgi:hypothetical protein
LLAVALVAAACGSASSAVLTESTPPALVAPQPCVIPAGHASAAASTSAGEVSLQITFVGPCDLSIRVSAVDLTVRYGAFGDVAAARLRSSRLAAPVVIYDVAIDGQRSAAFSKTFDASFPGGLDSLRRAICAGETTFELIGVRGTTLANTSVIPSNTGKC